MRRKLEPTREQRDQRTNRILEDDHKQTPIAIRGQLRTVTAP